MARCLPHTIYKSYSASYVENGRYDRLTEWLGEFTTEDLTGIDVTACDSLESWVEPLEAGSRLKPSVSWGTTGKVSFFPRSTVEADVFARSGFSSSMNERANTVRQISAESLVGEPIWGYNWPAKGVMLWRI